MSQYISAFLENSFYNALATIFEPSTEKGKDKHNANIRGARTSSCVEVMNSIGDLTLELISKILGSDLRWKWADRC